MIDLKKNQLTNSFEKYFSFVKDYGYQLIKHENNSFYSQVLYVNKELLIVVSITYDLRENILSVSAWNAISEQLWEMKNDKQSITLEKIVSNEENKSLKVLPSYDTLSLDVLDLHVEGYAKEFIKYIKDLPSLIRHYNH